MCCAGRPRWASATSPAHLAPPRARPCSLPSPGFSATWQVDERALDEALAAGENSKNMRRPHAAQVRQQRGGDDGFGNDGRMVGGMAPVDDEEESEDDLGDEEDGDSDLTGGDDDDSDGQVEFTHGGDDEDLSDDDEDDGDEFGDGGEEDEEDF